MDIDSLFKVPKLPLTGNKRKLSDNPTPEMLKKMRLENGSAAAGPSQESSSNGGNSEDYRQRRAARVEDVSEEDANDFAPGGDADYFAEEDDEGRFYGGGLTLEQKEILKIFESAAGEGVQEDPEELSAPSIRRTLLKFERVVNKNQDLRSKYPDDPTKFIDSEADLDAAIKSLLPLSQVPNLAYPEIVKSGTVSILMSLLSHENADIVIDVVEVIHELTDEDVGGDAGDEEEDAEGALKILIESLLKNSIFELLVDNLPRLNEAEESDRQGVFHILGIFENILGFNPRLATQLVKSTTILSWLLNRIQTKKHDENRGYAAELIPILLQDNQGNRLTFGEKDGVESVLKSLAQFRARDPIDADEVEFMDNLFDILCSALSEPKVKSLFLEAEGPDLMLLMMKGKLQSRVRSIKVLDYAMSGITGSTICENFVEILGLKTLFSALMGKQKKKSNAALPASEEITHSLGIISSLLSNIASDSPGRIRLLAKFVESNFEKVDKLLDIRDSAQARLKVTESEISLEKKEAEDSDEELEASWYLKRLDGGLFTLQTVDYILAWIIMEDNGIQTHALQMLRRKNLGLNDIVSTLKIFHSNIDESPEEAKADEAKDQLSQKAILEQLIVALSD